jgi:fatty-acyl-CoA synthase
MEIPLTPLEFARRARRLYSTREAVVDGALRLTYEQFFGRCDRWSAALQRLGIRQKDRIAYIAPNTHAQLESFYAVPQIGAVLVPINFRLTPDDFVYIINHSGASVVCAHADYLSAVDGVRAQLGDVRHFVALEGERRGWLSYESLLEAESGGAFVTPAIGERDLLTINYTSGTTSRPKGVMITHRNAYMNAVGTLVHLPMTCRDRYLWTLPMFHANGWTFTWIVTAVGALHVCLRKVDPPLAFELMEREQITTLCAAPTVLIALANAPEEVRRHARPGVRVVTAGAPPAAATIQRMEGEFDWHVT